MNKPITILPLETRDTSGESSIYQRSASEIIGAGAFVIDIEELAEGASLVVAVQGADDTYVMASNRIDRPGRIIVAVGPGLGVEHANVAAPQTYLPQEFKVSYVVAHGPVKFSVAVAVI
jgi:hypothetical protein